MIKELKLRKGLTSKAFIYAGLGIAPNLKIEVW